MDTTQGCKSRFLLAVWIFVLLSTHFGFGAESQDRAFLFDRGTNSVIALDTKSVTILGTASFEGATLSTMTQIPHSKRLAIFDRGPGALGQQKGSMSFVDMDSMKVTSRLELGGGILQVLSTDDGKGLAVLCLGYFSPKPEETVPTEVIFIDTQRNWITGRLPVNLPVNLILTPDNRTLITFTSAWHSKTFSRNPEVQFIEFGTGKVLRKLSPSKAVTSAELSVDGQYLYLFDPGKASDKLENNVNGHLIVVSVATGSEVSTIDVGSAPQGLIHDDTSDRILVLSDADPSNKGRTGGVLHVVKGKEAIAVVPVVDSPKLFVASPVGTAYYIAGANSISVIDAATVKPSGEIPITGKLGDLVITPDGKRGIVLFPEGDRVAVLDLEQNKSLASLVTGRSSQRVMAGLAAGMNAAAAEMGNYTDKLQAQQAADATGETQYYTVRHVNAPVYTAANVSLALSPDSKFAYALNDQTLDVSVIDTQAAKVLSKIGITQGFVRSFDFRIETVPGGNLIAVAGILQITFIDTKTNQKIKVNGADRLKLGGIGSVLRQLEVSPSGDRACAVVNKRIICLDTSTMKEVGRLENFKSLDMLIFEKPYSTYLPPAASALTSAQGRFSPDTGAFTSDEGHFSAWFPAAPSEYTEPVATLGGQTVTMHKILASLDNDQVAYLIAYVDNPSYANQSPGAVLQAVRDAIVKDKTITSDQPTNLNAIPGRAFTARDQKLIYTFHLFLAGNRLYQVVTAEIPGRSTKSDDAFLNSFNIH